MNWIWRNAIISTVIGVAVFIFLFYSETGLPPNLEKHFLHLFIAILLFNAVGAGMHILSRKYNTLIPWNRNITIRFMLEVTSGLILLLLACLLFTMLFIPGLEPDAEGSTFWQEYWDGAVKLGVISLVIVYVYSLVKFSIFSYNQYSVHQIDQLRAERSQLNLQFEALRTQLSPHFLFNALNTISSLIYKDVMLAEDFIRRMAQTYRYILRTNDQRMISLGSEMEMVRAYYFMQQIKFEDCVDFRIDLPEAVNNSMVPPMTLQMLMENAMKHNLICDGKKLVLEVRAEGDYLVVKNNIIPKTELLKIGNNLVDRPKESSSHKIGLNNIRSRYSFFTSKKIEIIKDQDFIVKLPLIYPGADENIL